MDTSVIIDDAKSVPRFANHRSTEPLWCIVTVRGLYETAEPQDVLERLAAPVNAHGQADRVDHNRGSASANAFD